MLDQQRLTRDMDRIHEHHGTHAKLLMISSPTSTPKPAEAFYAKIGARVKTYTLQPFTLVTFRQGLYLFAWDVDAEQVKTRCRTPQI